VLAKGETRLVLDLPSDERYGELASRDTLQFKSVRSVLAVPLKVENRLVGLLYLDHPHKTVFSQDDLDFLNAFANQAALAIHRAREHQRQLAEKACVSPTAITLMLRKMEAKGLVEKKTDPADRRFFSVSLTEKGKSVVEQLKRLRKSIDGITVIGFTQEEQAHLQSLLRTVRQNLLEQISANA